ncbi:hypothetical protein [Geminocystis sp.]|uniref:hypothetical protein n=1 Tax=Geminocystis sp. TaxID=2664100 RepID=UPI0035948F46
MTDTKTTNPSTTETENINVESQSEIILVCYKDGKDLKVRVISEGYNSKLNVKFPSDLKQEGALYSVGKIEKSKSYYYLTKENIPKIVRENCNTPVTVLEKLVTDSEYSVRLEVAKNPNTPVTLLEKMATDSEYSVRLEVVKNPNTPITVLEKLATDSKYYVRLEVVKNPNTPVTVLEKLATDSKYYVRLEVAKNLNTPITLLEKLATDFSQNVRLEVAKNLNTLEHLNKLANHKNPLIAQEAKLHVNWNGKMDNIENAIKKALEQSALVVPESKSDIVVDLDRQGILYKWAKEPWAKSIAFCLQDLKFLSYFTSLALRRIARSRYTPTDILYELINDDDQEIGLKALRNPNIPLNDDIWMLAYDLLGTKDHLDKVIKNFNCRGGGGIDCYDFEELKEDPRIIFYIRDLENLIQDMYDAGKDPSNSLIEILKVARRELAKRREKKPNPKNYPVESLGKEMYPDFGHFILFFSPYVEVSHLENNFLSHSWLLRYAIAQNPKTPDNTLSYLVKDGNNFVRSAAYINIKQGKLANQSADLDNSVRLAVKENPNTPVSVSDKLVCDSEKFELELQNLLSEQKKKNYKPMWVYYRMKEKFILNLEQLKEIASALGYKEGWAMVQYKEIEKNEF